jgi:hypothetical protein
MSIPTSSSGAPGSSASRTSSLLRKTGPRPGLVRVSLQQCRPGRRSRRVLCVLHVGPHLPRRPPADGTARSGGTSRLPGARPHRAHAVDVPASPAPSAISPDLRDRLAERLTADLHRFEHLRGHHVPSHWNWSTSVSSQPDGSRFAQCRVLMVGAGSPEARCRTPPWHNEAGDSCRRWPDADHVDRGQRAASRTQ